jgi:hypothetical protein
MISPRTTSIFASLMILTSSVAAAVPPGLALPVAPSNASLVAQGQPAQTLPRSLARRIQNDLAQRLNVPANALQIVEATPQTWPDQCLGLARPNERCRGGEVPGWRVQISSSQQLWTYRSDRSGQRLRLEPLPGSENFGSREFTLATSRTLLRAVAREVKQPVRNLRIIDVQPATWDGCLGIYERDRACIQLAIAGFRAIVGDGKISRIYHLNEDASQVAQNVTASGAAAKVLVSFLSTEMEPVPDPNFDSKTLFRSVLNGNRSGSSQVTGLLSDGTLYQEESRIGGGTKGKRTIIGKLTPQEVKTFQNLLEQQRFPNLNRMRYLNESVFADYPTIRLETPGVQVEYVDLEVAHLPPALRSIVKAWQDAIN